MWRGLVACEHGYGYGGIQCTSGKLNSRRPDKHLNPGRLRSASVPDLVLRQAPTAPVQKQRSATVAGVQAQRIPFGRLGIVDHRD